MCVACTPSTLPPPLQSKWTRIPRRRKRGPKFEGYQLHIRGALAAADARKTRLVLDGLGGRHQDTTGTQVGCTHNSPQQFLSHTLSFVDVRRKADNKNPSNSYSYTSRTRHWALGCSGSPLGHAAVFARVCHRARSFARLCSSYCELCIQVPVAWKFCCCCVLALRRPFGTKWRAAWTRQPLRAPPGRACARSCPS